MSNETFLIPIKQNNKVSNIGLAELRMDLAEHPLNQRFYTKLSGLPGNSSKYNLDDVATNLKSPLYGKKILFLGSSVTFGFGALAESFVDDLWKKDGVRAVKDAENGTTLVDIDRYNSGDSYVARFKENLTKEAPDIFVLQLSTNDATSGKKLGEISQNTQFDTQTITGALEYIIFTAQNKWHCPILLYTNPDFDNDLYKQMVERSHELSQKYHFAILDLFKKADLKKQGDNDLYMADEIHPTRAGYLKKWTPLFEEKLNLLLK